MKGVSAIIATILMLVITIGLAGTAYVYISGMLTGKTGKTISLLDYSCSYNATGNGRVINLVVSNDGTDNMASGDLTIYVDNDDKSTDFGAFSGATWAAANKGINSHVTKPILTNPASPPNWLNSGSKVVLVTSPSNSQRITVQCP